MNEEPATIPDKLRERFPHLQPVNKPPSLMTVNGIGLTLYGKRDFDRETETYVKTRCIAFLYIPLFFIDAFRVADAGTQRWFFLGKESLSNFARSWNIAMACLLVIGGMAIGWGAHTSSPSYRARAELRRAAEALQAGEPIRAAGIYENLLSGPEAAAAGEGLKQALTAGLASEKSETVAAALRPVAHLPADILPDAFDRGVERAQSLRAANAEGALEILAAAALLQPTNASLTALRIDVLKEVLASQPDNMNRIVELALLYESTRQLDEAYALLRPHQSRLGDTEGARILGQHLLQEGRHDDAYGLLFPYVQSRLGRMRAAEAAYTNAVATISRGVLNDLRDGRAEPGFYTRYQAASEAEQERMVDEYIWRRTEADPRFQNVLNQLKVANQIVPVALDLGIVQLNRAQTLQDPAARNAELQAAEKTFLAIRNFAGDTDEYRLFLGQVYYWLGRADEGRKLFDELLASSNRGFPMLMALAGTLRMVGESAEARVLMEEAYANAPGEREKYGAAAFRALLSTDNDDEIAWLEKSDPQSLTVQISLNAARGKRALAQGDKRAAAEYLRKTIAGYESQPRTAAALNNCGLAYFNLYEATGNPDDHRRGMTLLEQAIELDPGDSILLQNTMFFLISRAVMDTVEDRILPEAIGSSAGLSPLSQLYNGDEERSRVFQKLRDSEAMKKALAYLDKALLLSPKNLALYTTAASLHASFRDLNELQKLRQKFQLAAPDISQSREEVLKAFSGAKDEEYLERLQVEVRNLEELARNPRVQEHPLTHDLVTLLLVGERLNTTVYGAVIDADEQIRLALAAYERHPTSMARGTLQNACYFKAAEELASQHPEFAALRERTRRVLGPETLFALMLDRGGPMAEIALRNANVQKGLALEKEIIQRHTAWSSSLQWALLRNTDAALAATVAERIRQNEAIRVSDELQYWLNPVNARSVLDLYWTKRILGDDAGAQEIYRTALRDGVPLPPL